MYMFDKIITVSCNPALDATIKLSTFDYDEPNLTLDEQTFAAGKGVNVSKVLHILHQDSLATGFLGMDNLSVYTSLLEKDGISFDFVTTNGVTRENLTLILPNGAQVKINRRGLPVTTPNWVELYHKIDDQCKKYNKVLLVFSGSVPNNLTNDEYTAFILSLKKPNVEVAIDSNLLTLDDYKKIKPFIIKPNFNEMKKLMSVNLRSENTLVRCINELSDYVEHILVSLGAKGLLYGGHSGGKEIIYKAMVPKVTPLSTVGAGDSTLAGFIAGLQQNLDIEKCLQLSTGCGTASVLREGTEIITYDEAMDMQKQVVVVRVKKIT